MFSGQTDEDQKEDDCELLLKTPDNELTVRELERKKICEQLLNFDDSANDQIVVEGLGQTGLSDFANTQSGLSVTISATANLASNVGLETTFVSNNFTHLSDEDTIKWFSNAISNAEFLRFTSAGHVSGMQLAEDFTAASTLEDGDLCYLDSSGEMDLADADAETTADTLLAVATEVINAASSVAFLLNHQYQGILFVL